MITFTPTRLTEKIDQCALYANRNLKDASEIDWSYDKDSEILMIPSQTGMLALNTTLLTPFLKSFKFSG